MVITALAIDLAKRVFQLHGADAGGKCILRKTLKRDKLAEFVVQLPPCTIYMEACGSAHYWARKFRSFGHEVRLIAAQHVRPFRIKTSKDDAADAAAIYEAGCRPSMHFVDVKEPWQQDLQFLHRIRQAKVEGRTALCNQYRGFLYECGLIAPQGIKPLKDMIAVAASDLADERIPPLLKNELGLFLAQLSQLDAEIGRLSDEIEALGKNDERCKRLATIPGIGMLTATALVAAVGDGRSFRNGRHLAAWLGLVPGHSGTGGKVKMHGITKHGDTYLRYLLVHGGRCLVAVSARSPKKVSKWILHLAQEKHASKAAVAIANKNARIAWALLATKECYNVKRAWAA